MPQNPTSTDPRRELTILWMKAQPSVGAFICSIVRDRHDADDLLQSVALTATDRFHEYDRSRPFGAWAMGIARKHVLNYLRQHAKHKHVFSGELIDSIADIHEELSPTYDTMKQLLEKCLRRLKELEGRAYKMIEMRYTRDMKPREMAECLGTTPNTVRIALHRVRAVLRRCIDANAVMEQST